MLLLSIIPATAVDKSYDYLFDNLLLTQDIFIGSLVQITFGKQLLIGVVIEIKNYGAESERKFQYKHIDQILPTKPLPLASISLGKFIARYSLSPLGLVFKQILKYAANPSGAGDQVYLIDYYEISPNIASESEIIAVFSTENILSRRKKNWQESKQQLLEVACSAYKLLTEYQIYYFTSTSLRILTSISISELKLLINLGIFQKITNKLKLFNEDILSEIQKEALEEISQKLNDFKGFRVLLLDGVTGSGKTEIYLAALSRVLNASKDAQGLLLLPEIMLSSDIGTRIHKLLGLVPDEFHSNLTNKNKIELWLRTLYLQNQLVIGVRSALFLPFANLKLIIVDEEHDQSYKQDILPIYQARDMAIMLGKILDIPVILVSATPSLESFCNHLSHKYQYIHLAKRFGEALLPEVELIDMSKIKYDANSWISPPLKEEIANNLAKSQQVLLFLNRRGYSPLVICTACGFRFQCDNCSVYRTFHAKTKTLICHYCNDTLPLADICPSCLKVDTLHFTGPGVERIAEEAKNLFPDARIIILSSEMTANRNERTLLINDIKNSKFDIIVGTQIISKGFTFPNLTLVGIIDGDFALDGADIRSAEKSFQLLTQVAGRSGRSTKSGKVLIQTYSPQHTVMQALKMQNRELLYQHEIAHRQQHNMPPFGELAILHINHKDKTTALQIASNLSKILRKQPALKVLGPTTSPVQLIKNIHRINIMLKIKKDPAKPWLLQLNILNALDKLQFKERQFIKIDINPYSFL